MKFYTTAVGLLFHVASAEVSESLRQRKLAITVTYGTHGAYSDAACTSPLNLQASVYGECEQQLNAGSPLDPPVYFTWTSSNLTTPLWGQNLFSDSTCTTATGTGTATPPTVTPSACAAAAAGYFTGAYVMTTLSSTMPTPPTTVNGVLGM